MLRIPLRINKELVYDIHVINDGSGNKDIADYKVRVYYNNTLIVEYEKLITGYRRDLGLLELTKRVINAIDIDEVRSTRLDLEELARNLRLFKALESVELLTDIVKEKF